MLAQLTISSSLPQSRKVLVTRANIMSLSLHPWDIQAVLQGLPQRGGACALQFNIEGYSAAAWSMAPSKLTTLGKTEVCPTFSQARTRGAGPTGRMAQIWTNFRSRQAPSLSNHPSHGLLRAQKNKIWQSQVFHSFLAFFALLRILRSFWTHPHPFHHLQFSGIPLDQTERSIHNRDDVQVFF